MDQSAGSLAVTEPFGPEVLGVTRFAVDFSVFFSLGGRLQALATFCTAETVLVPRLPGTHDLLSCIDRVSTPSTFLRASELLGKFGRIGVGGGSVSVSLFRFDSEPLSSVHVERSCSLSVAVAFRAVFLPVARLAVDLLIMDSQCGAV